MSRVPTYIGMGRGTPTISQSSTAPGWRRPWRALPASAENTFPARRSPHLTAEQAERVKRLIHEGMAPRIARAEVLGHARAD